MSALPAVIERNVTTRQEFGATQQQSSAETAGVAVAARERAKIEAQFVMAERHPRSWDTVRVRLLQHCERPGFAEVARYQKPVGKKKINGEWVEQFAEGLSARFAEVARQEMCNTSTESTIVYEDDLIRIVRASVLDVERNTGDAREITVAKAVEKRGRKRSNGEWDPPEGREIIGNPRTNSYGEPVWLVKATDDEIRSKQNSEISKAQRDESLRLIPKDIRDDCEAAVIATLEDPNKVDPAAARKKLIDAFAKLGVIPDDLVNYIGVPLDRISPAQLQELRGLFIAIKDGEADFQTAMRRKYEQPDADVPELKEAQQQIVRDKTQPTARRRAAAEALTAVPPAEKIQEVERLPDPVELVIGTLMRCNGKTWAVKDSEEGYAWSEVTPSPSA